MTVKNSDETPDYSSKQCANNSADNCINHIPPLKKILSQTTLINKRMQKNCKKSSKNATFLVNFLQFCVLLVQVVQFREHILLDA